MYKLLSLCIISLSLANCTCNCKYNEYLPENNPLVIPEDLKPVQK
ncbi:MAG: hypothetical protein ACI4N3_02425 [Alphaproteobacteria bacterium]